MPGIPHVGGSSTVTGTTLLTLREKLARKVGYFVRGTVTAVAAGLEPERYVISSTVRGDSRAPSSWDGHYLYVTNGDEQYTQRALMPGTFEGPTGALYLDEPFDSGPLALSTTFEVSQLPAADYQGVSGLNRALNESLHTLPAIDFISQTVVADQVNYPLTNQAWRVQGVRSVSWPRASATGEMRVSLSTGSWGFEHDAEIPSLTFGSAPGNVGDTFEVEVLRPADTWIKTGGAWGDSATGLVLDTDACVYDANTVIAQAYPIALEYLAQTYPRGDAMRDTLMAESERAATAGALARWFGGQRGSGVQRVGATGGGRSWAKGWRA